MLNEIIKVCGIQQICNYLVDILNAFQITERFFNNNVRNREKLENFVEITSNVNHNANSSRLFYNLIIIISLDCLEFFVIHSVMQCYLQLITQLLITLIVSITGKQKVARIIANNVTNWIEYLFTPLPSNINKIEYKFY